MQLLIRPLANPLVADGGKAVAQPADTTRMADLVESLLTLARADEVKRPQNLRTKADIAASTETVGLSRRNNWPIIW